MPSDTDKAGVGAEPLAIGLIEFLENQSKIKAIAKGMREKFEGKTPQERSEMILEEYYGSK